MINERRRHNSGLIQQLTCLLCIAQWCHSRRETATMRDQLLAMIVVVGTLVAGWMVVSGTRRTKRERGSSHDGSSGGGDGGDWSWFSGHGHSGDHASGGDSGGGDGGG